MNKYDNQRIFFPHLIGAVKLNENVIDEILAEKIIENGSKIEEPSPLINDHHPTPEKHTDDIDMSVEKPKSALENLAEDLETIGKYKDMNNDVKETDMIAFKVFTPNFEKSDYVIGLVESIIGKERPDQQDYDLSLSIMGKYENK